MTAHPGVKPLKAVKPTTPGIPHGARMRAYIVGAIVSTGLMGVAYRAYALQVTDGDKYAELASKQHGSSVNIPAPRGDVLDARGRPLAVSADADSIWANPREIKDLTDTADKLARILGEDAGALESKLAGDRKFVWLDRHVDPALAQAVRAAKLPGIVVEKEPRRWYPARSIGGTVIGRADIDNRGIEGLELSMDEMLQGTRGSGRAVRDARGAKMFADGMAQPEPGPTVKLTLDRSIQAIADEALMTTVKEKQAAGGVAVVLDVKTSQVLAMSSWPTYDPNSADQHAGARNKPVTDAFEAGSVMKIFSISAALDAGVVTPTTGFDTGAPLVVGGHRIPDVHFEPYLTTGGILKHSSNIGTGKIALRMGRDRLYAALKSYGFGAKTGIELPGETTGRVRKGDTWRELELATISFGYGITVTPLQIATGLAAIANDGVYTQPRIVESVTDQDGTVKYAGKGESHRMMQSKTARQMRTMLESVFEGGKEGGTAKELVVPGFRCAGKTGTAHKYDPVTKRYAEHRYLSSFAGLAPAENPRLAIVVLIDDPTGGDYFGGKVAGPVFAKVASESLRYLGVPGMTLQCPMRPPGYNASLDTTPKTCVIPAPKPAKKPDAGKPVVAQVEMGGEEVIVDQPAPPPEGTEPPP